MLITPFRNFLLKNNLQLSFVKRDSGDLWYSKNGGKSQLHLSFLRFASCPHHFKILQFRGCLEQGFHLFWKAEPDLCRPQRSLAVKAASRYSSHPDLLDKIKSKGQNEGDNEGDVDEIYDS
jgi:hypothetical protein